MMMVFQRYSPNHKHDRNSPNSGRNVRNFRLQMCTHGKTIVGKTCLMKFHVGGVPNVTDLLLSSGFGKRAEDGEQKETVKSIRRIKK